MDKNSLFRKSALERLSTPEQLDTLMQVVSPRSWLALLGMLILVFTALGWAIFAAIPSTVTAQGILIVATQGIESAQEELDTQPLTADVTGRVSQVLVSQGDYVETGQNILVIEQDNDEELFVTATFSGLIVNLNADVGSPVTPSLSLADVLPLTRSSDIEIEVVAYVSIYEAQRVAPDMRVEVSPLNIPQQEFGFLHGTVRTVGQFPSNTTLAQGFAVDNVPVIEMRIALERDDEVTSGYAWSIGSGPERELQIGVVTTVNIIVDEQRPIQRLIPLWD